MNYKKMEDTFFNSFHSNHVLLYVGRNISNDELTQWIARCPWSCIITSRKDPELANLFILDGQRDVYNLTSRAAIPLKPLSRKKLPIIRLFGVDGEEQDGEDLAWLEEGAQGQGGIPGIDDAAEMIRLVPEFMDHVNPLVIIGANSDEDWQVFSSGRLSSLLYQKTTDGTVSIWDMPEESENRAYAVLKQVAEKKNFGFYTCSLSTIIQHREQEVSAYSQEFDGLPANNTDVYYQGQTAVSIEQTDLLLFKNVGTLLTERTVNQIQPLGREQGRIWFSNFLEASSSLGPQWYGYLPRSTFYVKRNYEDALVHLVRRMLEGRGVEGNPIANRPIILCGDPGSSKSITLGALAYRIYNERINPVIYISKENFLSASVGTGIDDLDEAMRLLEQKSAVDTRILVIWDSSSYRAGIDRVRKLLKNLQDRGRRRFVLVCSSYNLFSGNSEDIPAYSFSSATGKYERCSDETAGNAQIFDQYGCYFVKANRVMTKKEQEEFWNRAREYSGINPATISLLRERLRNTNQDEIFHYYYTLITLLRDNLEESLRSEQSKISPYVEKELAKVLGTLHKKKQENQEQSAMYQALVKAGLDPSQYLPNIQSEQPEDTDAEERNQRLDQFNLCVALFSRFKLSVPYGLAFTILAGSEKREQYSESGLKLFKLVTTSIPWISYGEDEDGEFSFRFRNPLEADIYLRSHDIAGLAQVKLLGEIIDIYGADYRRSGCKDLAFTENLQALLRLMGPNTGFTPFFEYGRKYEHLCIQKRLDEIIVKLENLIELDGVPDEDAGFTSIIVTFIREYYGYYWRKLYGPEDSEELPWLFSADYFNKASYETRINKLIHAISLAEKGIEDMDDRLLSRDVGYSGHQHFLNQRFSLVVETALSSLRLEELIEEYCKYCAYSGETVDGDLIKRKLSYRVLYNQLQPMITAYPTNGYAYNTLFKLFENMYKKESLTDTQKLQYLTEIMQVVETCETYNHEIVNRGSHNNDELSSHLANITAISTGIPITLNSIRQYRKNPENAAQNPREQAFFELFDEMLDANNPAAITFVCQKEIRIPKGRDRLNTDELLRCRNAYNFMREEKIFDCVCGKEYSLSMLIRMFWMMCNETTLTNGRECQLTRLKDSDWLELYQLCSIYCDIAGDQQRPLITLIYALSTLHVNRLSEQSYVTAQEMLSSIPEQRFGQNLQRRMWTPFMICDASGNPVKYSGTVLSLSDHNNGTIRINGVPQHLGKFNGVRFHQYNLGKNSRMPDRNQALKNLELGIGYMGFSVYTSAGRSERGGKE